MTILVGAYCFGAANIISTPLKETLRQLLRTQPDERGILHFVDAPRFFLTKWDSCAFNELAWQLSGDGSLATLVGDPLLTEAGKRLGRSVQLSQLIDQDYFLSDNKLKQTRGAFSAVAYCASKHTLSLATDMIGLRSLYYTVQDDIFIFASALRVFERLPNMARSLSTAGMLELSVFGFPLANRTPYKEVAVLRECEKLTLSVACGIESGQYHDWEHSQPPPSEPEVAAEVLFSIFKEGIRLRLESDKKTYAFLSGGMDSRAIVSTIASLGCEIEALNFSPSASQDQAYACAFAKTLGPQCHINLLPRDENPNFSMLAFTAKSELERKEQTDVSRPAFFWSGDGGSVGLGHVYLDERMIQIAERGNFNAAMSLFLAVNRLTLPTKAMTPTSRQSMQDLLFSGAVAEMNRYARPDGGRRLYLFLLFNDQRRHLFKHFETIDQHGLEFHLPFFDVHFLKYVIDTPARWGAGHNLYSLWFNHLTPSAVSTPWQTYPGHQPCPIQGDESLSYQWRRASANEKLGIEQRRVEARLILNECFSGSLPEMFSRPRLILAAVSHYIGLRDCRHILAMLQKYRAIRLLTN